MFIIQFGCCVGYLFYVSDAMEFIISYATDGEYKNKQDFYILLLIIPTIPVCLLKTYKGVSYISMVGVTSCLTGGFILIGYYFSLIGSGDYNKD